MKVKAAPRSAAAPPYQHQACRQDQFFPYVEQVKTSAVYGFNRVHILPGDDDKEIQEKPPRKQKGEVERSNSESAIILLNMRLHCHCSHHGNDVQKENHVPDKRIRRLMSRVDFQISPHEL